MRMKNLAICVPPCLSISIYKREHRVIGKYSSSIVVSIWCNLALTVYFSKLKEKGLPWERAKAFDGSAVFTDFIQIKVSITSLIMELLINDQLVQEANYDLMIYKPETLLSNIQAFMSCEDGDIIMTGTPKGVGTYTQGDHFEIKLFSADKLLIKHSWQAV